MEKNKFPDLKIVPFDKVVEESKRKRKGVVEEPSYMSDDEIALNAKVDSLEHLLSIGEMIVEEICELEKKVGKKEITENLARFLANWNATIEVFDHYYDNS